MIYCTSRETTIGTRFFVTSENHYNNRCQQSAYLKTDALYGWNNK